MNPENPYQAPEADTSVVEANLACPTCATACEKGIVQAFGSITWYPEMTSFKRSVPNRLSPKGFNLESNIPAVKCPKCMTIIIEVPQE